MIDIEAYRDLFKFAVLSGLRQSELFHLKVSDVDVSNKLIRVVSDSVHRVKTGKTRYVELHASLIPIVERKSGAEFMFRGTRDNKLINRGWIEKTLKKYLRRAGLDTKLNFRAFRSTYAKWMLEEGVGIEWISHQLGNSPLVCAAHYSKFIPTDRKEYVNKIQIQI